MQLSGHNHKGMARLVFSIFIPIATIDLFSGFTFLRSSEASRCTGVVHDFVNAHVERTPAAKGFVQNQILRQYMPTMGIHMWSAVQMWFAIIWYAIGLCCTNTLATIRKGSRASYSG
jgi:hypothetical protein